MKKLILLIVTIAWCVGINAQEKKFAVTSKISGDTLKIKWIPKDQQIFKALLDQNTEIYYIECEKGKDISTVRFSEKPQLTRISPKQKSKQFSEKNPEIINYSEALFVENKDTNLLGNFFANALIQNFLDKKIMDWAGNFLDIPACSKEKLYAVCIKNKGIGTDYTFMVDPSLKNIEVIEDVDHVVSYKKMYLLWNVEKLNSSFCAYNIYKRHSTEKKFTKLNKAPIVPFGSDQEENPFNKHFEDGAVKQGETYYYQIKGVDFFGDESGASEIRKVYIRKEVNGVIAIDTVFQSNTDRIVQGELTATHKEHPIHVSEVLLFRSDSLDTGYILVDRLKMKTASTPIKFTLKNYKTGDHFYYKLKAISPDMDSVESLASYFFTYDQEPPKQVSDVTGKIDSNGVVTLTWIPSNDLDIQGYRVFRGNHKSEEFFEVTKELHASTLITDTMPLNTLTNEVYYFVRTVDLNYNNSPNSDTILVIKPDTIAPVAGLFLPHDFSLKGITLHWVNSCSEDLSKSYIVRTNGQEKITLVEWKDSTTRDFFDSTVVSGTNYSYVLVCEDKSSNTTSSPSYSIPFETGFRETPNTVQAEIDRVNKKVILKWKFKVEDVYSYQIYRAKEGESYKLYKTISDPQAKEWEDEKLTINTKYAYRMVAVLRSGISTKMSDPVEIIY